MTTSGNTIMEMLIQINKRLEKLDNVHKDVTEVKTSVEFMSTKYDVIMYSSRI